MIFKAKRNNNNTTKKNCVNYSWHHRVYLSAVKVYLSLFFIAFFYWAVQHWERKKIRRRWRQRWYISMVIICWTTGKHKDFSVDKPPLYIFMSNRSIFLFGQVTEHNQFRWVNKLNETENFNDRHTQKMHRERGRKPNTINGRSINYYIKTTRVVARGSFVSFIDEETHRKMSKKTATINTRWRRRRRWWWYCIYQRNSNGGGDDDSSKDTERARKTKLFSF